MGHCGAFVVGLVVGWLVGLIGGSFWCGSGGEKNDGGHFTHFKSKNYSWN